MKHYLIFALWLVFSVLSGAAQTNRTVLPPGFATQNGDLADPVFEMPFEFQQIYRSSSVSATWQTPVRITEIAFRMNEASSSFSAVIPRVEIRLSPQPRLLQNK